MNTDNTNTDNSPPDSDDVFGAGDPLDFSALVAEQNASTTRVSASEEGSSRSKWWRIGFPIAIVAVVLLLPLLAWTGLQVILDSTDGQLSKRVTDPAAPNYEAALEKTPTELIALTTADGSLDSIALFSLISNGEAAVMVMPAGLIASTQYGEFTAATIFQNGGIEGLSAAIGGLLKLGFTDQTVVTSAEWQILVGPYGALTILNPDPVKNATDQQIFPKGSAQVPPSEIWTYLSSKGSKESDLNRLVRQQAFWKSWLAAVGKDSATFSMATDSGLGYFITTAAKGRLGVSNLPVIAAELPAGSPVNSPQAFRAEPQAAQDAVAAIVPFPDGGGMRARFKILDGTGVLDHGVSAAVVLAAAGGQVDIVGNASSFDVTTTVFVYYDGTTEVMARRFRDVLGIGELVESKASNSSADIMLILGSDYVAKGGSASADQTTTTMAGITK